MAPEQVVELLRRLRVLVKARVEREFQVRPMLRALERAGARAVEIDCVDPLGVSSSSISRFGHPGFLIGYGPVFDRQELRKAYSSQATWVTLPSLDQGLLDEARRRVLLPMVQVRTKEELEKASKVEGICIRIAPPLQSLDFPVKGKGVAFEHPLFVEAPPWSDFSVITSGVFREEDVALGAFNAIEREAREALGFKAP